MALVRKKRGDKRCYGHGDANVHVHAEGVDERISREELLLGAELEEGQRRAVKAGELVRREAVLEPVLDLGDEDNDADGDAEAATEDTHLRNDALRDGCQVYQLTFFIGR